jgi:hypothetical protein
MLDAQQLKAEDLQGLDAETASKVMAMVQRLTQELHLKETKLQKLTFELARLKTLKFGTKTEVMDAEQRRLFEETLAEDEASLDSPSGDHASTSTQSPARYPAGTASCTALNRSGWRTGNIWSTRRVNSIA